MLMIMLNYYFIALRNVDVQHFDTRWDEILLSVTCGQYTLSHATLVHIQRITERIARVQSLITRTRVAQVVCLGVLKKKFVSPASCLICCRTCHRTLLHDLSHLPSDHLLPHSLVLRNWIKKPCESHGRFSKSASPTGHEPKLIQSHDFEPLRIELDRNLGTDPNQIPERILGDDYQNPITEDTEETGKIGDDMPRIHSDYDAAETIAPSDLEDGELRKMLASPLCVCVRGENYGSSPKPTASGKPEAKIIPKREASAQRTQAWYSIEFF